MNRANYRASREFHSLPFPALRPRFSILCFLVTVGFAAAAAPPAPLRVEDPPAREVFDRYCFDCHGDGAKKGNFSLEELLKGGPPDASRPAWQKAWKIVRHGFMPPSD